MRAFAYCGIGDEVWRALGRRLIEPHVRGLHLGHVIASRCLAGRITPLEVVLLPVVGLDLARDLLIVEPAAALVPLLVRADQLRVVVELLVRDRGPLKVRANVAASGIAWNRGSPISNRTGYSAS